MKKRLIVFACAGLVIAAAGLLIKEISRPAANTLIDAAPSTAEIVVNGKTRVKAGTIYLTPGKYTIKASLKDFTTVEKSFEVPADGKAVRVSILLNPANNNGLKYLTDHPDLQHEREAIGSASYGDNTAIQLEANPIISLLPWEGLGYVINYGQSTTKPDDPTRISLIITSDDDAAKTRALNWIRFNGYDPADYDIETNYSHQLD